MIIGIGGLSRSGKTSLAKKLSELLSGSICILKQDYFVKNKNEIPTINGAVDWECPESMDFIKLEHEILKQSSNYDTIIVEGILVFYTKSINKLFNKRILLKISEETFLTRKQKDTRWGDVPKWFMKHIWETYCSIGELGSNDCLKIIAEREIDTDLIVKYLNLENDKNQR